MSLLAIAAFAAAAQAVPPSDPEEARFRACAAAVQADPLAAVATANAWLVEAGGLPARQCLGLALVAAGRWEAAAEAYEAGARAGGAADDPRRADFWVQAGNAWLAADEPARAVRALDAALVTPHLSDALRGEAHLDRARAQVAQGDDAAARTDLDRALALVPEDPFAWYLSAALAGREGDLARARTEIARAVALAPDDPDVLLLSGTLAGLAGDMEEAERLYRRVAAIAPDSAAGRQALASLPEQPQADPGPPEQRQGR